MYQKQVKKVIFTLNIGNSFAPELTKFTYPLLKHFAKKIGAEIYYITERKFPDWPVTYEKFQIYELAQQLNADWYWYLDSDALIHPDMMDITNYLIKHTVCHNGADHANIRWSYDRFFSRDSRHIGSANWCAIASDWCIELWKPLDDLTLAEALSNIHPVVEELNTIITADHLIDDYVCSRNIAKYGLKFNTIMGIYKEIGFKDGTCYFYHQYTKPIPEKVKLFKEVLWGTPTEEGKPENLGWNLPDSILPRSLANE
jgi:hypothetical protein